MFYRRSFWMLSLTFVVAGVVGGVIAALLGKSGYSEEFGLGMGALAAVLAWALVLVILTKVGIWRGARRAIGGWDRCVQRDIRGRRGRA